MLRELVDQSVAIDLAHVQLGERLPVSRAFAGENIRPVRAGTIVRERSKIKPIGQIDYPLAKHISKILDYFAAHQGFQCSELYFLAAGRGSLLVNWR